MPGGSVFEQLSTPERAGSRYGRSTFRLMLDDLHELTDAASRLAMIGAYLYSGSEYLLQRYGVGSRAWLHVVSGAEGGCSLPDPGVEYSAQVRGGAVGGEGGLGGDGGRRLRATYRGREQARSYKWAPLT